MEDSIIFGNSEDGESLENQMNYYKYLFEK